MGCLSIHWGNFTFTKLMSKILMDGELLTRFVTLDIELNSGVHPKVKNRTAWILACLDLVKKKVKQREYKPLF